MKREISILQVSPTGYSSNSVIGGGEKCVLYVDHALRRAAAEMEIPVKTSILVLDGEAGAVVSDHGIDCRALAGRAWDPFSIDACKLAEKLSSFERIYIHQCLCQVGLFAAAHAKLLGKFVIGADSGGGEYQLVRSNPGVARIYRGFHAYSRFGHRAGLFVQASTHFDYLGRYHHKPELLGLAPLEALSTGLRALVSDAGALPELAGLAGCWCFRNATELSALLQDYLGGTLPEPSPHDMHAAVTEQYGLLQFGEKLLKVMEVR